MPPEPQHVAPGEGQALQVLGNRLWLKVSGQETADTYELFEQRGRPGDGVPPHMHSREDETFYVVAGEVRFEIGGRTIVAGPGTTLFAPRGVMHAYWFGGETDVVMLFVVSPAGLAPMFAELSALPSGDVPDIAKVLEICGRYGIQFGPPA
jgi:quercetin dioxygenase-like cupin family protein